MNYFRYSYEAQPAICKWNVKKLGEMFALVVSQQKLDQVLESWEQVSYQDKLWLQWQHLRNFNYFYEFDTIVTVRVVFTFQVYDKEYQNLMRRKLGLLSQNSSDADLFSKLFKTMQETHSDFTTTFLLLQSTDFLGMTLFLQSLCYMHDYGWSTMSLQQLSSCKPIVSLDYVIPCKLPPQQVHLDSYQFDVKLVDRFVTSAFSRQHYQLRWYDSIFIPF